MITHSVYLDFNQLNTYLTENNVAVENRLQKTYELLGGEFWNEEKMLLKGAKVFLCGVGGLLFENHDNNTYLLNKKIEKGTLKHELMKVSGASSFMSYFNLGNLNLTTLGDKVVNEFNHTSVLHTMSLNVFIIGHSIGVEHELSSQRDLVHLSRLTVAKTKAQSNPPLTLLNEKLVPIYQNVLNSVKRELSSNINQDIEAKNLLFPTAKSSMLMLSGSYKNFQKLIALKDAGGKEDELIDLLVKLEKVIHTAFE